MSDGTAGEHFPAGPDIWRSRLIAAARWSFVGAGVGRGIAVIAMLVVAHLLGPAMFGGFTLVQTTVLLLSTIGCFSAGLSATQFVARHREADPESAGRHAALALMISVAGGILLATVLWLTSDAVASLVSGKQDLAASLRFGTPLLVASAVSGAQVGVLSGLEDFRRVAFLNLLRGVALVPALILGAHIGSVAGATLGLGVGEVVGVVCGQVFVRRSCQDAGVPLRYRGALSERRTLIALNLPAFAGAMATQPALWLGQVFLAQASNGLREVGYFALAYRWYLLLTFVSSSLTPVGLAMLNRLHSRGSPALYRRLLRQTVILSVLPTAIPAAGVVLLAPVIARLSGDFLGSVASLRVLAVAALASAVNNLMGQAALSLGLIRAWMVSDLVLAAVLIGVAAAAAPHWGAAGLAAAFLLSMGATCLALMAPLRNGTSVTHPEP